MFRYQEILQLGNSKQPTLDQRINRLKKDLLVQSQIIRPQNPFTQNQTVDAYVNLKCIIKELIKKEEAEGDIYNYLNSKEANVKKHITLGGLILKAIKMLEEISKIKEIKIDSKFSKDQKEKIINYIEQAYYNDYADFRALSIERGAFSTRRETIEKDKVSPISHEIFRNTLKASDEDSIFAYHQIDFCLKDRRYADCEILCDRFKNHFKEEYKNTLFREKIDEALQVSLKAQGKDPSKAHLSYVERELSFSTDSTTESDLSSPSSQESEKSEPTVDEKIKSLLESLENQLKKPSSKVKEAKALPQDLQNFTVHI